MELQEKNLKRMNDDLRSQEEQTAEKLAVTNQLYQKLKHQYTQAGSSPTVAQSIMSPNFSKNVNHLPNPDPYGQRHADSQYHRGAEPESTERAGYFSAASGSHSRTHVASAALEGRSNSVAAQCNSSTLVRKWETN